VDNRAEVREFLTSRRAKITPDQARVPQAGHRRVPGLRRSEVAALAGMSVEYYAKLERGALAGASASVLDAIARALQLDEAERAHLFHLAQAADGTSAAMRLRRRSQSQWTVRPSLQWTLDSITTAPAIVGNNRSDLLATNDLGRRCTPTSTTTRKGCPTSPGLPSSTALPTGFTPTGTWPPT
jgi:transcriptional regulator with XRE-family HTH domain